MGHGSSSWVVRDAPAGAEGTARCREATSRRRQPSPGRNRGMPEPASGRCAGPGPPTINDWTPGGLRAPRLLARHRPGVSGVSPGESGTGRVRQAPVPTTRAHLASVEDWHGRHPTAEGGAPRVNVRKKLLSHALLAARHTLTCVRGRGRDRGTSSPRAATDDSHAAGGSCRPPQVPRGGLPGGGDHARWGTTTDRHICAAAEPGGGIARRRPSRPPPPGRERVRSRTAYAPHGRPACPPGGRGPARTGPGWPPGGRARTWPG